MSSESQNDQFKLDEVAQSNIFNDITDKFRAYRQNADATAVKLREANTVIDQLKTEINMSRNVEESLRSQILSAQDRLIHLQRTVTKILRMSEQIHQSEKVSLENERKIGEIQEAIQKTKEECRNFSKSISNELNLMNEIEELKLKLKNEKSANNVLKIKNKTLSKQKEKEEMQHKDKCRALENDIENLRREKTEMQVQFDLTLRAYKKQVEDHEFTIKEYERERKSLIEEFATPKLSEDSSDIAWVDNSIQLIPEDRSPKNFKSLKRSTEGENKTFSCSKSPQNVSFNTGLKHVNVNAQKSKRQKPQLEFLTSNSEKPSSDAPPLKRRLFSMNCNHYVN